MFDCEYSNCWWVNALDETIVVEKYGDGHLNKVSLEKLKSYVDFANFLIIYMAAILVFELRWSMGVFHYLV